MQGLVIVDMQGFFPAANKTQLKEPIIREINRALSRSLPIVVLEYSLSVTYGRATKHYIKSRLIGYEHKRTVQKFWNDGSNEVHKHLEKRYPKVNSLRVCGVNTDMCVQSTCIGLDRLGYGVTVVADACDSEGYHWLGIKVMRSKYKIKVINDDGRTTY